MLSDNSRVKYRQSKRSRAVGAVGKSWSDSQKLEAITTYLSLGDLRLTASVVKIPEGTLRQWKSSEWWKTMEGELRVQDNIQLSARLKRMIEGTLSATEERLSNGDWIYDSKQGQLIRKPVSMKDAHKVAMDLMDRRDILDNQRPQTVSIEAIDDKLKKLAERFEQMAKPSPTVIEVTDVVFGEEVDANNG